MHLAKDKNGQNVLMYSNGSESKMSTKESIEEDQEAITTYLVNSKRHQIKINPKFATDNTKTNLKSNNADYLKYLIDNNILSTNAVVNEPTFQGYTNIYLNTGVTVSNQPKVSESGVEVSSNNSKESFKSFKNILDLAPSRLLIIPNPSKNLIGFSSIKSLFSILLIPDCVGLLLFKI